jgi:acyl-CoA reductase-like NAD-dependent aldehyde dehydrogenase
MTYVCRATGKHYIGGLRPAQSGAVFDVVNPATGEKIGNAALGACASPVAASTIVAPLDMALTIAGGRRWYTNQATRRTSMLP